MALPELVVLLVNVAIFLAIGFAGAWLYDRIVGR